MTIKLVTDSTCDLPAERIEKYGVTVVPMSIHFGEKSFRENITIHPDTFYDTVLNGGIFPKTSQPSVGEFLEVYKKLAAENPGAEIISIHLSSKLSGTFQSASLAAEQAADTVKVHVIDSLAGSGGLGWMVAEAGELVARGKSAAEICETLNARRKDIVIFLALDNLKFAQLSGRVGKIAGFISAALNIKPIVSLNDGALAANYRARSIDNAMKKIVALLEQQLGDTPVNLCATHALNAERAHTLLEMGKARLNVVDSFVEDLSISVAGHLGPGTVGLVAYPAAE